MKKKLKHLFLLCLFGMISIGANAEIKSGECGDNAKWSLDTTTGLLSITGSGDMTDYTSTGRIPWYNYRSNIKSLSIGDKITSIGEYAFYDCSGLTSVTIPNSVTEIGARAFHGCSGLTSVTIPNSVTSITGYAFSGCSSLPVVDNIRYADTYLVEAVNKTLTTYNIKGGTKWIGAEAFYGCDKLTNVTIPNSVTSIGMYAFYHCI